MNQEQIEEFVKNLQTPLEAIVSYANQLVATDNKEIQSLYANIIETNSKLLQQMIKGLSGGASSAPVSAPAPAPAASVGNAPLGVNVQPVIPVQAPKAEAAPAPAPAPAPVPPRPAGPKEKPLMLIAEDNESNYFLFQAMLEDDYELIHAWDGVEAIELYKQHNPALILMDINMPRMDGYEATRELRKLTTTVPIIAVTAYVFVSDRERIMEIGFNGYVSKPVDAVKLANEIENCMNGGGFMADKL